MNIQRMTIIALLSITPAYADQFIAYEVINKSKDSTVQMNVLVGHGYCDFDDVFCADNIDTILEIDRDGKAVLIVPRDGIDNDTLRRILQTMIPVEAKRFNHPIAEDQP